MLAVVLLATSAATAAASWCIHRWSPAGALLRRARRFHRRLIRLAESLDDELDRVEDALEAAAGEYSEDQFQERLAAIPVTKLIAKGARWSALEECGVRTLADLTGRSAASLENIPGVGRVTAQRVSTAAADWIRRIGEAPIDMPGLAQLKSRSGVTLFARAWALLAARQELVPSRQRLDDSIEESHKNQKEIQARAGYTAWLQAKGRVDGVPALEESVERLEILCELNWPSDAQPFARAPWRRRLKKRDLEKDVERRYADFVAVLEPALGLSAGSASDVEIAGVPRGLTSEVVERIQNQPLEISKLRLTLRRYQDFGARYMLAQRRTLLGDEMGLGKTIQALAAMVHIESEAAGSRFLVICPASIVTNWCREIESRTDLAPRLIHGRGRDEEMASWISAGGVAVSSYAGFRDRRLVQTLARAGLSIDLLIADEAHYVKNPEAARSAVVRMAVNRSLRVSLMSGTPIENRLAEFSNLFRYISPPIAREVEQAIPGGTGLAQVIAPAYLRRNQEDVLKELPPLINKPEWLDLSSEDRAAYNESVLEGNYARMRQTVTLGGPRTPSVKLSRLLELVEEYRDEGRKVIVFSFFLGVLARVADEIPHIGILQGSVPLTKRAAIVDRFQAAEGHAVLLAQVMAGGVGLNLHAASAVVIMEPQWKPSTEEQAIARAHRMGQVRSVVAHRLLARETIEERLVEVLEAKQKIFDEHARPSDLKDAAAAANESQFAARAVASEQAALLN